MRKDLPRNFNNTKNLTRGFTLIETFVAVTILMIAVLGPMTLLSRALQDARYIGDIITATYLAQEGVEIIIDQRNQGTSDFGTISSKLSCPLGLNKNVSPVAGYVCGSSGKFTRAVEVTSIDDSHQNQKKITSTVSFLAGDKYKDVSSYSIIFVRAI